jgi:hypothetical protein
MNFAKIVEVDGEQVLFYLEPDKDEDEREMLNQIVRVDGLCINVALGGFTYERADAAFAGIDETYARKVLKMARDVAAKAA